MASDSSAQEVQLFTRRASGLTRTVSPWGAFAYAFVNPGQHFAVVNLFFAMVLYGGVAGFWSVWTLVLLLPIGAIYVFMSLSMPRSGGEYIYVSRILHPLLGFIACWVLTLTGFNWTGLLSLWFVNWGVGQTLFAEGLATHNATLVEWGKYLSLTTDDSKWVIWIIGTVILWSMFFLMSRGTKAVIKLMWVILGFQVLFLITYSAVVLSAGPERVLAGMQAMTNVSWADVMAKVQEVSGGAGTPPIAVGATIFAGLAYINMVALGTTYAANISGEIKKINVAQPLAQMGTLIAFIVWWIIFVSVTNNGLGEELVRNLAFIETQGQATALFGTFPVLSWFIVFATDNWLLIALGGPTVFAICTYGSALALSFAPSRNLFAFSFDGLLPSWVSKVSRNGSPNNAVILSGFIAWAVFTVATFTTWLAYHTYTTTTWFIGWVILGIAAAVFPYVRRDIFEKSPAVVQSRIVGVPVITILGIVGFLVSVVTIFSTLVVGDTVSVNWTNGAIDAAVFVALPIIIYVVAYAWQRAKGVPMDLRFKTIPPD